MLILAELRNSCKPELFLFFDPNQSLRNETYDSFETTLACSSREFSQTETFVLRQVMKNLQVIIRQRTKATITETSREIVPMSVRPFGSPSSSCWTASKTNWPVKRWKSRRMIAFFVEAWVDCFEGANESVQFGTTVYGRVTRLNKNDKFRTAESGKRVCTSKEVESIWLWLTPATHSLTTL